MMAHVTVATPYYLLRIIMTKTQTKDALKAPSILHRYLNKIVQILIWYETLLLAQNKVFDKAGTLSKKQGIVEERCTVKPAEIAGKSAVGQKSIAFDDSCLPVQVLQSDSRQSTRAVWYRSISTRTKDRPVMLYLRRYKILSRLQRLTLSELIIQMEEHSFASPLITSFIGQCCDL
jgi:hypothetical protein